MVKVRLPFMIQDQRTARQKQLEPIVAFDWDDSKHQPDKFLDGPVSTRVACLDFSEESGALEEPIVLDRSGMIHEYRVARDPTDRAFNAVSVFAIVHKTLNMYESADVLGRRVTWAFDGPQLLIVPRAGNWKNAFYERESRSLQFFSFATDDDDSPVIHTSLSLDIVAHEVGHAVLDAVAPHLYDCVTPQSLAIHEAIGDLTALFVTLDIRELREKLLDQTGGEIRGLNAYTQVAEEFGFFTGRGGALRTLWNQQTLADVADPTDFHELCQIVTGAVYELLVSIYDERRSQDSSDRREFASTGRALVDASRLVGRFALRGLDYLPPGEISFADYGRAAIAADATANPNHPGYRERFATFLARRIGVSEDDLFVDPPAADCLRTIDVDALMSSDWHAYQLVQANLEAFCVPEDTPFRVEPRVSVEKETYRGGDGPATYVERLIKVSWEVLESGAADRWVRFGTTVALDGSGRVKARVTTNPDVSGDDSREARELLLERLLADDLIADRDICPEVVGLHDSGAWRLSGTGRCLHLAGEAEAPSRRLPGRDR